MEAILRVITLYSRSARSFGGFGYGILEVAGLVLLIAERDVRCTFI